MNNTLAEKRLVLGAINVGTGALLSLLLLLTDAPRKLFSATALGLGGSLVELTTFFLFWAIWQGAFDILGGIVIERRTTNESFSVFVRGLVRSAALQTALLVSFSFLLLTAAKLIGVLAFVAVLYGILYGLEQAKLALAQLLAPSLRGAERRDAQVFLESDTTNWTGGFCGRDLVLPKRWLASASPLTERRILAEREGYVARGAGLAKLFIWIGVVLFLLISGLSPSTTAGMVTFHLWMTVWMFIGLVTLPSVDRAGCLALDEEFRNSGADAARFRDAVQELDRELDDEPQRSPEVERIFHPIPMLKDRLEVISGEKTAPDAPFGGVWNSLRQGLYLSWGVGNLVCRAVHCSVGRRENWVFLPVD